MRTRKVGGDIYLEADNAPVCDFCSDPKPVRFFGAADVQMTGIDGEPLQDEEGRLAWSKGAWAACETCAKLIEHGNRAGLRERAFWSLSQENRTPIAHQAITVIHNKFFESRK